MTKTIEIKNPAEKDFPLLHLNTNGSVPRGYLYLDFETGVLSAGWAKDDMPQKKDNVWKKGFLWDLPQQLSREQVLSIMDSVKGIAQNVIDGVKFEEDEVSLGKASKAFETMTWIVKSMVRAMNINVWEAAQRIRLETMDVRY